MIGKIDSWCTARIRYRALCEISATAAPSASAWSECRERIVTFVGRTSHPRPRRGIASAACSGSPPGSIPSSSRSMRMRPMVSPALSGSSSVPAEETIGDSRRRRRWSPAREPWRRRSCPTGWARVRSVRRTWSSRSRPAGAAGSVHGCERVVRIEPEAVQRGGFLDECFVIGAPGRGRAEATLRLALRLDHAGMNFPDRAHSFGRRCRHGRTYRRLGYRRLACRNWFSGWDAGVGCSIPGDMFAVLRAG